MYGLPVIRPLAGQTRHNMLGLDGLDLARSLAVPFDSHLANPRLIADLNAFAYANSFPDLYRSYSWKNDTFGNGFPDISCLESRLIQSDRTTGVTLDDVKAVTVWGALRNQGRIKGPALIAPRNTFHTP